MKILIVLALALVAVKANKEAELLQKIVSGYPELGEYVRPVQDISDTVSVSVSYSALRILKYDAKGWNSGYGTLTVAGWAAFAWQDSNIGWDPKDYDGIESITIPADLAKHILWTPDIVPYDGTPWEDRIQKTAHLAIHTGQVMHVPPTTLEFQCSPDHGGNATRCTAVLGSWTHNGYLIDIAENPNMDLSEFLMDPEWTVLSGSATREVKTYPCCPEPYPSVTFALELASAYGPFDPVSHEPTE